MNAVGFHGPKEHLAVAVDRGGVSHAIYPTASRTLCSMHDDELGDVVNGLEHTPDCLVCVTTAAAFDRIDRSAPSTWFRREAAAA